MTVSGDLRPSLGKTAGWHDWIDPAGPEFLRWEPTWPEAAIDIKRLNFCYRSYPNYCACANYPACRRSRKAAR
jgi:hypothetical protein